MPCRSRAGIRLRPNGSAACGHAVVPAPKNRWRNRHVFRAILGIVASWSENCKTAQQSLSEPISNFVSAVYVPYRSVSKERQEEFKREVGERAAQRRADGMTVFADDEAAVQRSQNPAYGWRPTGGREQVRTSFSRESVRIFGAMSQDELRIKIVESTNSETFQEFLEEIRRDRPRLFMVLDNASYHKSKAVREYVESAGGDVELEFLPPYTPQLNPVETVWRDLKKRLAGRFFRSLDELKAAITAILEREMGNRLKGYLVA